MAAALRGEYWGVSNGSVLARGFGKIRDEPDGFCWLLDELGGGCPFPSLLMVRGEGFDSKVSFILRFSFGLVFPGVF